MILQYQKKQKTIEPNRDELTIAEKEIVHKKVSESFLTDEEIKIKKPILKLSSK